MNNQKSKIPTSNIRILRNIFEEFKSNNIGIPLYLHVIDDSGCKVQIGIDYFRRIELNEKRMVPMFEKKKYLEIFKREDNEMKN